MMGIMTAEKDPSSADGGVSTGNNSLNATAASTTSQYSFDCYATAPNPGPGSYGSLTGYGAPLNPQYGVGSFEYLANTSNNAAAMRSSSPQPLTTDVGFGPSGTAGLLDCSGRSTPSAASLGQGLGAAAGSYSTVGSVGGGCVGVGAVAGGVGTGTDHPLPADPASMGLLHGGESES